MRFLLLLMVGVVCSLNLSAQITYDGVDNEVEAVNPTAAEALSTQQANDQMVMALINRNIADPITVFPNPADDVFYISMEKYAFEEVVVFNMVGQVVYQGNTDHHIIGFWPVHTADWQEGNYILYARVGEKLCMSKVMVKH